MLSVKCFVAYTSDDIRKQIMCPNSLRLKKKKTATIYSSVRKHKVSLDESGPWTRTPFYPAKNLIFVGLKFPFINVGEF